MLYVLCCAAVFVSQLDAASQVTQVNKLCFVVTRPSKCRGTNVMS